MPKQHIQPNCSLTDVLTAALGAAREAAVALDRIAHLPTHTSLVAPVQRILAADPPLSEDQLEVIGELLDALNSCANAERGWSEPEGAASPIEQYTPDGKLIRQACFALAAARTTAALAADRWRAEGPHRTTPPVRAARVVLSGRRNLTDRHVDDRERTHAFGSVERVSRTSPVRPFAAEVRPLTVHNFVNA